MCVCVPSRACAEPANEVCSTVVDIGKHFPLLQREREVRAFVEDLRKLRAYHRQQNKGTDIDSPPPPSDFSAE